MAGNPPPPPNPPPPNALAPNPPLPSLPPNPPAAQPLEATYKDVLDRLKDVSKAISDLLRTLGIGIVVFCWGLFTAEKGLAVDVANRHHNWIVITAATAVLGLIVDLLHAIAAYRVANRLRMQMEANQQATGTYDYGSLIYRSQNWFFWSKSILMPGAAVSIIVLLFVMVWNAQPVVPAPVAAPVPCCQGCPAPPVPPVNVEPTPTPHGSGKVHKPARPGVKSGVC
jgi:hypothetical protein